MAIPSPIEMPDPLPVNDKVFDLTLPQLVTPVGNGFIQTIDRSSAFWVATYKTPVLQDDRLLTFQAFIDELEGSKFTFLGFDPDRTRPYAYRAVGGLPWEADHGNPPRIVATDYADSTINLDRFAVGAILTKGDYVSFQDGLVWRIYRAKETKVADGSGAIADLKVTPRPVTLGGNRNLRLVKPCAEMKVLGAVQKTGRVEDKGSSFSFAAVQFIQRGTE